MNKLEEKFKEKTGLDFKEFYKTQKPKLVWYLTKWTKSLDLSEDFVADAFIQALKKIDSYDDDKSQIHTWLYTIALNIVKKDFLDRQKINSMSLDKVLDNEATLNLFISYDDGSRDNEKRLELCKKSDIVKNTIYEMPEKLFKYRTVLIMREIEHMSYNEIADELELNLSTVKSQIKKGREIIVKKVEKKLEHIDKNGI